MIVQPAGSSLEESTDQSSLLGRTVLDGSAGLGIDAFALARAGATVTLVEKSPVAHCLLQDGFQKAAQAEGPLQDILSRMHLYPSPVSCAQVFEEMKESEERPDIIFLDLMNHIKKKHQWRMATGNAKLHLPRYVTLYKHSEGFAHLLLSVITGSPTAEEEKRLISQARGLARDRVVQKQPYYAEADLSGSSLGPFRTRNWRCNVFLTER